MHSECFRLLVTGVNELLTVIDHMHSECFRLLVTGVNELLAVILMAAKFKSKFVLCG